MRKTAATSLRTALAVAAAVSIPGPLGMEAVVAPTGATERAQTPAPSRATLVGTYRLIRTEVRDAATGSAWSIAARYSPRL